MIEEVSRPRLAYQFTHELVRRALYDRMPGLRRAELHLRVAEALERARPRGESRGLAELAYHFGAAAPVDGPRRAIEYSLLAGRAALRTLAFDEAAARFASALELGIDDPRRRARDAARARHRPLPRGWLGSTRWRRSALRRRSPARSAIPAYSRPPRSASRRRAGGRGSPTRARSSCSRRRRLRSGRRTPELRVMAARRVGSRVCVHRRLRGERRRPAAGDRDGAPARRSAWPGDRAGALLLVARRGEPGADARDALRGSRPRRGPRRQAISRAEAMEWRGSRTDCPGRPAARRSASSPRSTRSRCACASRSRCTSSSTTPRRSPCAGAAGRGRGGRAALARVEPSADRPRPPRASTESRCSGSAASRAASPSSRRSRGCSADGERSRGAWRPGFAALLAELGMEEEARRELARVREDGSGRISLHALGGVADLSGRRLRARRRRDAGRACSTQSWCRLSGGNVVIGHGVACYGAADRYLGTAGRDARRPRPRDRTLRARAQPSTAPWAHARGSPTPSTSTAGRCGCAAATTMPAKPRRCSPRRRRSPSGSACRCCWRAPARSERHDRAGG